MLGLVSGSDHLHTSAHCFVTVGYFVAGPLFSLPSLYYAVIGSLLCIQYLDCKGQIKDSCMDDTCWLTIKTLNSILACACHPRPSLKLTGENKSYLQFWKFLWLQQMATSKQNIFLLHTCLILGKQTCRKSDLNRYSPLCLPAHARVCVCCRHTAAAKFMHKQ